VKYKLIIVRYGEIALKSKETRKRFESTLVNNIKNALKKKQIPNDIKKERGRIYVYTEKTKEAINVLQKIFGIHSISPAIKTQSNISAISELALQISKEYLTKEKSFAVRVTRTGKHDFTSQDVAIKTGSDIVKATKASVNLTKPDFKIFIEIRDRNAFVFTEKIRGTGGLPIGTQGRVLCVVETPRSILASWYLMRRGCNTIFITTKRTTSKLLDSFISKWYINTEIISVKEADENLYKKLNKIALEKKCDAIVSDITLYGTKSNYLRKIKFLKQHLKIPVLYPLIAMDKKTIDKRMLGIGLKT
jgi:thiamine biosynthesis protein ThiI